MATVYLAIQEVFEREVALKVMSKALAEDPNFGQRFFREAKIVSKLVHPNIVTVHDVGMHEGHCFLSMEYIDGRDLKFVVNTLSLRQKIQVIIDIAKALDYAGSKGYVHRDIKPENIMFHSSDGRAVLMDFGIARAAESDTMVTQAGTAIGTPHYMSPEQAKGKSVDYRSDIYSLGVVLFYILSGRVPYDAESAVGIGIKHITEPVPLLPKAYENLQSILDLMMAKDVTKRYQNAKELMADLAHIDLDVLEHTADLFPHDAKSKSVASNMSTVVSLHDDDEVESFEFDNDDVSDLSDYEAYVVSEEGMIRDRTPILSWFLAGTFIVCVALVFVYFKNPAMVQPWIDVAFQATTKLFSNDEEPQAIERALKSSPDAKVEIEPSLEQENRVIVAERKIEKSPDAAINTIDQTNPSKLSAAGQEDQKLAEVSAQIESLNDKIESLHLAYEQDSIYLSELVSAYRELLSIAPSNEEAKQNFNKLKMDEYDELLQYANKSGTSKNLDNRIRQLRTLFPEETEATYANIVVAARTRKKVMSYILEAEVYLKQNSLTKPEGRNALDSYKKALDLDKENAEALRGKVYIAQKLSELASKQYRANKHIQALDLSNRALAIDPQNETAIKLKKDIQSNMEKTQVISTLLSNAERKISVGQLFTPQSKGAFHDYRSVLDLDPNNDRAKNGLERVVDALSAKVWQLVGDEQFLQAKDLMRVSLREYGGNERVKSLSLAIDEVIGEKILDVQPRIEGMKIHGSPIESHENAYSNAFSADRSIFLGFRYENFQTNTTVIQAVLMDGGKLTQIAQVPVVVEGRSGLSTFRIDRPVDGFPSGSYSIEMRVGRETLNSTLFKVK